MRVLSATANDESSPSYSPDGLRVVYTENFGTFEIPLRRIMIMNADGSGKRTLTSGADDSDPVYTLDGLGIVFSRAIGASRELFYVNRDGTGMRQLTNLGGTAEGPSCGIG